MAGLQLVLLGDPVAHSLSPLIHAAALDDAGIAGTYASCRVDSEGVAAMVELMRKGRIDGANVTMPHKQLAARLCDRLSDDATRAQSVNTLVLREGEVVGETTDVQGIRSSWNDLPSGPVLLLGAGGAAAAALLALEGREIFMAARQSDRARSLLDALGVVGSVVEWGEGITDAVVVNATPLGMNGEALPDGLVSSAAGLFDMAYGPSPTPAVTRAAELRIPAVSGRQMLVAQAAESFRIWTGIEPSLEAMVAALS